MDETQTLVPEDTKPKHSFLKIFLNFLMFGGWLVIVALVIGIIIAVSVLTGGQS
jgi:hypothetical protein